MKKVIIAVIVLIVTVLLFNRKSFKVTEVDVTIDTKAAVIFLPDDYNADSTYPLALMFHGAGNTSANYKQSGGSINQKGYVQMALENGYIAAVVTNDVNPFGDSDVAIDRNKALYDYVAANYSIYPKCVFFVHSAGGAMGHNVARDYPAIVAGFVGVYPVYDYAYVIGAGAPAGASAYNPKNFSSELVHKYVFTIGGSDDVVIPANNTLAMANEIPGEVKLYNYPTGEHAQDANYVTGASKAHLQGGLNEFKRIINGTYNRIAGVGLSP